MVIRLARKRPGARYLPVGFRSPACASQPEASAPSARRCIAHELLDELTVLIYLYAFGAFDKQLAGIGLNVNECARNGLGQTFCGKELTEARERQTELKKSTEEAATKAKEEQTQTEAKAKEEQQQTEAKAKQEQQRLEQKSSEELRRSEQESRAQQQRSEEEIRRSEGEA
ncbi:MAG: hypothetical protein M3Z95_03525 [Actinomycetota bacterium]|nr:hypothetical protein [Actinomycetota bacterium]